MNPEEWRFSAKLAWHDWFIKWTTVASLVVFACMTAYMLWRLIPEGLRSGMLTTHYTIYLGIDEVKQWAWVLFFPVTMLAILVINAAFSLGLYRRDHLAARTLTAVSLIMSILWGIGSFFIVVVNL